MTQGVGDAGGPATGVKPGALTALLQEVAAAPDQAAEPASLSPGTTMGRFEILRELGRGGFGTVYEAFDPELNRVVAVKTLRLSRPRRDLSSDWIKKEAEAVARLDHPSIVTLFDVGTCDSGAYLVMELLRGETLAKRLEKGPLPVDEALRIAEQMAAGLAHAHSRNVLHRDLKPANVFVCEDGRVKLLDFGLAHLLGTEGSSGAGTPAYMAPEQAAGQVVDERADVYAAGMVLAEMLTGERPAGGPPSAGGARAPRSLARALESALAGDPAMRPSNGGSWLAALRAARLSVERTRRGRRVAGVAAAFLVLGVAVAAIATWRVWERQIPGGRPTVAVADFANETGDGELAGLSGLLTTSLEQGTQLRVLTRSRMLDVLRQLGKGAVDQIDEPLAREVGRAAGAQVLLLASVRKLGESYVVEMRALDPLHDEYAFTVIERATGKEGIFDLVDRLGAATRRRLGDGGGTSAPPRKVASITTTNVKAWELLSRSRQALDGGRLDEAHRLAQGALEADPEFALARYQVAVVSTWGEDYMESRHSAPRDHVLAAERFADHLPEKERLSLKAMSAEVRSDWEEATRLRDQLVNDFPLDKEAVYWAGRARLEYGDVAASIPYLQRALQLDPFFSLAVDRLVAAFDASGRAAANLDWLREQVRTAREGFALRALGRGLLAAGREQEALDVYRRAAAADGAPWPPADHLSYMAFDGRAAEAEGAARRGLAALTPGADVTEARPVRALRLALSNALLAQGRFAEYRAAAVDTFPDVSRDPMVRQWLGALARDRGSIRTATDDLDRSGALDMPLWGFGAAVNAALAGEVSLAGPIARRVLASPRVRSLMPEWRRILGAVSSWERGFAAEAERELDAVGSHEFVGARYAAWLVLGELRRSRGDCGPAVAALEQARGVAWSGFLQERYGSHAGVLHSLATCYEKMGDLPKARERNDEMLRLWAMADPDIPLLLEAKAMRARLMPAGR